MRSSLVRSAPATAPERGYRAAGDETGERAHGADLAAPEAETRARRWYVAHTRPHKEGFAEENLRRLGFTTFAPRIERTVRSARRSRQVLRPMFPRYLFVAMDLSVDRWRSAAGAFGVANLIMASDRPRPVRRGEVEALAEAADGRGAVAFAPDLSPGDRVRFLAGPMADRIGTLVALDDEGRVAVLMEMLGAARTVRATTASLAPAAD